MSTNTPTDTKSDGQAIDYKDPETLRRLYWEEEMSLSDIANKVGMSSGSIRYHMKKHGIARRDSDTASTMKNDTGHPSIFIGKYGYWICQSIHNGETDRFKLSRLLATLLVDDISDLEGKDVHHINEHKDLDYLENLDIMTRSEHWSHHITGSNHLQSKLDEDDVYEIKRLLAEEELSQTRIGNRFGVDQTVVSKINVGRAWSHVEYP